jgi:Carboxypeptidase regulatory-like domain
VALIPSVARWCAPIIAGALLVASLEAQDRATLVGTIRDKTSGHGIANAQITLLGGGRFVVSDSAGKYLFPELAEGSANLLIRAVGFKPESLKVTLVAGHATERAIQLDSISLPTSLAAIDVSAPATEMNFRMVEFERRRANGRGQYLTEAEIMRMGAYSVPDALRILRGVVYECGGGGGCYVRMSRAPMQCLPEFIVDDHVMNDFGPSTPIRDVVGLELYTGPSEVPAEYAGRNAGCGVVVIWTRSGPRRHK